MSDYYKELGAKLNREELYNKVRELIESERRHYGYVYDEYNARDNERVQGWNDCLEDVAYVILDLISGGKW